MAPHPEPLAELLIRYRGAAANWKSFRAYLQRLAQQVACAPFTVVVVSDAAIRRLNRDYRGKDSATDVLSFPSGSALPGADPESLGDIVISAATARRAATAFGWPLEMELQSLALHGVLHLMGYDHETDRGQMARAERRWGRQLGLPQTLIARTYSKKRG
jgi:probable rRNA maturation factor